MSNIKFEISVESNIAALEEQLAEQMEQVLTAIGMAAETNAKEICPVDTGRLRNSISNVHDEDSVYIGTNVEYAEYQEFGGSKGYKGANGGRGYLRPAITDHVEQYKAIADAGFRS